MPWRQCKIECIDEQLKTRYTKTVFIYVHQKKNTKVSSDEILSFLISKIETQKIII